MVVVLYALRNWLNYDRVGICVNFVSGIGGSLRVITVSKLNWKSMVI